MNTFSDRSLDPMIVDLWVELSCNRKASEFYKLDDISKAVLLAVAFREASGQSAPNMSEIETMISIGTRATIYNKIRDLTNEGWLLIFTDPTDRRSRRFYLAARAVSALNSLSSTIKKVGRSRVGRTAVLKNGSSKAIKSTSKSGIRESGEL